MEDGKTEASAAPATLAPAGSAPGHRKMKPGTKAILDFAPLLLFFVTSFIAHKILGKPANPTDLDPGLMWATIVFMPATVIALAITYAIERRVHAVPLVTAAIVLIFGGLTLALRDDFFIKIKPTILYLLFAAALLGGLRFNRLFLKDVLSTAFDLDERGWRSLTVQWGLYFVVLAIVNEVARRVLSTTDWIAFKVWGFTALILLFSVWQAFRLVGRAPPAGPADKAGE